ncbi:hypothetical protein FOA43_002757 [Brettanomyces nanus]|uniref:Uncharacterized protein n=1 Tax=Eeniella nana TaxID=13502 RepID=A0A875S3D6_EENNA|nr:uncharacterized protein FOA43_002757 [Brettanomyces nanus]QPG75403.1 hypothetical protein FOA43_002757 [Brettanomyces nanus]
MHFSSLFSVFREPSLIKASATPGVTLPSRDKFKKVHRIKRALRRIEYWLDKANGVHYTKKDLYYLSDPPPLEFSQFSALDSRQGSLISNAHEEKSYNADISPVSLDVKDILTMHASKISLALPTPDLRHPNGKERTKPSKIFRQSSWSTQSDDDWETPASVPDAQPLPSSPKESSELITRALAHAVSDVVHGSCEVETAAPANSLTAPSHVPKAATKAEAIDPVRPSSKASTETSSIATSTASREFPGTPGTPDGSFSSSSQARSTQVSANTHSRIIFPLTEVLIKKIQKGIKEYEEKIRQSEASSDKENVNHTEVKSADTNINKLKALRIHGDNTSSKSKLTNKPSVFKHAVLSKEDVQVFSPDVKQITAAPTSSPILPIFRGLPSNHFKLPTTEFPSFSPFFEPEHHLRIESFSESQDNEYSYKSNFQHVDEGKSERIFAEECGDSTVKKIYDSPESAYANWINKAFESGELFDMPMGEFGDSTTSTEDEEPDANRYGVTFKNTITVNHIDQDGPLEVIQKKETLYERKRRTVKETYDGMKSALKVKINPHWKTDKEFLRYNPLTVKQFERAVKWRVGHTKKGYWRDERAAQLRSYERQQKFILGSKQ